MNWLVTPGFESSAWSIQSLEQGFTEIPSCKEIKVFLGLKGQSQVSQWPEVESKTIRRNTSPAPQKCYQRVGSAQHWSCLETEGYLSCRWQDSLNEDQQRAKYNLSISF